MAYFSAYPTEFTKVNLRVIPEYLSSFPDAVIGYSGHEIGLMPSLGAVTLGARIVERHVTLDKSMRGNDHKCSLDFNDLAEMVRGIRIIEQSLGESRKTFQVCIITLRV